MGTSSRRSVLLIGASRGLGLAMAEEYLERGWQVTGTGRGSGRTCLHELAERSNGQLWIETVDINLPDQVLASRQRLESRSLDLLFVNAGVTNGPGETIANVSTEEFTRLMGDQRTEPDAGGGDAARPRPSPRNPRRNVLATGQCCQQPPRRL
jgi:NAD(P)-dependent dehydrogenase (short-subunit alcohol dehydrogenase family)